MTRLIWGVDSQKRYESGVDHGVLYPSDGPGVIWNGLTNVEEAFTGGELASYYFDGIKYLDITSPKTYQATVTALSAPDEFGPCLGDLSVVPGFILTRQPRRRFGFSYRTLIGDNLGYKIHIVYNASASPSDRGYATLDGSADVPNLAWTIDAVPPKSDTYRPSAHFVVDSTKTDSVALEVLETILYGSGTTDPRLLDVDELIGIAGFWSPFLLIENQISGFAQLVEGLGDVYETPVPGIYRRLPNSRLVQTSFDSGYYRMES